MADQSSSGAAFFRLYARDSTQLGICTSASTAFPKGILVMVTDNMMTCPWIPEHAGKVERLVVDLVR
jgi:hypothetical protein